MNCKIYLGDSMPTIYENKSKTGVSWIVTLPKDLFKAKGFKVGDEVEFMLKNGDIIIQKAVKKDLK